jgi:hypothetical protein
VGKPEGRKPLGIPRHRWGIILKWSFEKWGGCMDWIDLTQDWNRWQAVVSVVMNLQVPYNSGNFLSSLGPVSFSGRTLLH